MRVWLIAAMLLAPSVAFADPHGWGLWIDRGGEAVALQDVKAEFSKPTAGPPPSIQAGYGWRAGAMAAVVGYDQPPGERVVSGPGSGARYPGAAPGDTPGVMGLSFALRLR